MLNKNKKINNLVLSKQEGFSHIFVPLVVIVILGIVGSGDYVYYQQHKTTDKPANLSPASNIGTKPKVSGVSNNKKTVAKITTPTTSGTTSTSTSTSPSINSSTLKNTITTNTSSSPATTPSSTPSNPTIFPLSALTTIITDLQNGESTQVAASVISIPGPIGNALGQPIVFSLYGQTYFAYRQDQFPNFNTSPEQTANSMAIVDATQNVNLVSAYLDKSGLLVDPDQQAVGFSSGGN